MSAAVARAAVCSFIEESSASNSRSSLRAAVIFQQKFALDNQLSHESGCITEALPEGAGGALNAVEQTRGFNTPAHTDSSMYVLTSVSSFMQCV